MWKLFENSILGSGMIIYLGDENRAILTDFVGIEFDDYICFFKFQKFSWGSYPSIRSASEYLKSPKILAGWGCSGPDGPFSLTEDFLVV